MQVEEYIVELLSVHECVVIPGFGGFVKKPAKASHVPLIGAFSPPHTSITFNSKLIENDGLLLHTISQKENKTFSLVKQELNQYVSYLKSSLHSGETVMLQNIGFLFLEATSVRFVAMTSVSERLKDKMYFGLPSYSIQPLPLEQPSISYDRATVLQSVRNYAAVFILLINVLLLLGLFSPLREPIERASLSFFAQQPTVHYKARPVSTFQRNTIELQQAYDLLKEVDQMLKSNSAANQTQSSSTIPSLNDSYKLIVGCFKSEENAQKSLHALSLEFKEPFYFYHQGLYKVCVFSSHQKDMLLQKKVDFENKTGLQTWILDTSCPNS